MGFAETLAVTAFAETLVLEGIGFYRLRKSLRENSTHAALGMAYPMRNARPQQSKRFTDATTVEPCLSLSSENAVKTQMRCAIASYILFAIIKKELQLDASLYTCLQILSVPVFGKNRFHAPRSKLSQTPPAPPH